MVHIKHLASGEKFCCQDKVFSAKQDPTSELIKLPDGETATIHRIKAREVSVKMIETYFEFMQVEGLEHQAPFLYTHESYLFAQQKYAQ